MIKRERTHNWTGLYTAPNFLGLMLMVLFGCQSILPAAAAQSSYTITDLGGLGISIGNAINNRGEAVGWASTDNSTNYAFLYSGGQMLNLGTLGGSDSVARGINEAVQIVGNAQIAGDSANHAFLYSGGQMLDLGTLGGSDSVAEGINNLGQVVGYANLTGSSAYHAFLYSGGHMLDLGTLRGFRNSVAEGINNHGQVVGSGENGTTTHAFLYSGGHMLDLGTLGGSSSAATGINNSGQIVGEAQITGDSAYHAFLYNGAKMLDIGTFGGSFSVAFGINNLGQVVGHANLTGNANDVHAFLYSRGKFQDLNNLVAPNSGWLLFSATAINDLGQIVGWGFGPITNGPHAFLLTPANGK